MSDNIKENTIWKYKPHVIYFRADGSKKDRIEEYIIVVRVEDFVTYKRLQDLDRYGSCTFTDFLSEFEYVQ